MCWFPPLIILYYLNITDNLMSFLLKRQFISFVMTVFMILTCYISLPSLYMFTAVKVPQHPDDVDHFLFNVLHKSAVLVCIFFKLSIKAFISVKHVS